MKDELVDKFVEYCRVNLNLESSLYTELYNSLAVCIIDCFYSLRAKYFLVTVPVVERYAKSFMDNDKFKSNINCKDLITHIDSVGGYENFAITILNNRQKISRRFKAEICYEVAQKLLQLDINSIDDFKNYSDTKELEATLYSIKGVGVAGVNYLFMLAGDQNRCKPDVHIHHCVKDACGMDLSAIECQQLFSDAIKILNIDYPKLTIRRLDGIIWEKYQARKNEN
ncbi:MAG: hypothetical protein ACI4MB_03245 [Candidatus Coproplasma sp.]